MGGARSRSHGAMCVAMRLPLKLDGGMGGGRELAPLPTLGALTAWCALEAGGV